MECLILAPGQVRSVGTLIPSDVASHPFNLAESCAFVRLDSDKSDNLRPNGDYDELAMCSLCHIGLNNYSCRTIDSSHKYLPSVVGQNKSRHPFRDRCPPYFTISHSNMTLQR